MGTPASQEQADCSTPTSNSAIPSSTLPLRPSAPAHLAAFFLSLSTTAAARSTSHMSDSLTRYLRQRQTIRAKPGSVAWAHQTASHGIYTSHTHTPHTLVSGVHTSDSNPKAPTTVTVKDGSSVGSTLFGTLARRAVRAAAVLPLQSRHLAWGPRDSVACLCMHHSRRMLHAAAAAGGMCLAMRCRRPCHAARRQRAVPSEAAGTCKVHLLHRT